MLVAQLLSKKNAPARAELEIGSFYGGYKPGRRAVS
jgi:hypothetical protein